MCFYIFSGVKNSDFRALRARKYILFARFAREKIIPRAPRAEHDVYMFFRPPKRRFSHSVAVYASGNAASFAFLFKIPYFLRFFGRKTRFCAFLSRKTIFGTENVSFWARRWFISVHFYIFSDAKNSDFRALRARKYILFARFAREKIIPRAPRAEHDFTCFVCVCFFVFLCQYRHFIFYLHVCRTAHFFCSSFHFEMSLSFSLKWKTTRPPPPNAI